MQPGRPRPSIEHTPYDPHAPVTVAPRKPSVLPVDFDMNRIEQLQPVERVDTNRIVWVVLQAVSLEYQVAASDVCNTENSRSQVAARKLALYVLSKKLGIDEDDIWAGFGVPSIPGALFGRIIHLERQLRGNSEQAKAVQAIILQDNTTT